MATAKPPGADWESGIDQVIRDGRERGEFDDLPGKGKPIAGLSDPHDELWWVRKKLAAEGVSYLPPTLALRKDREDTLALVGATRSEPRVRELLEQLNERIRAVNRRPGEGPPSTVMPIDVEAAMAAWREVRAADADPEPVRPGAPIGLPARPSRRWRWRRPR